MLADEIKKNINKCARCALCSSNCPIFKIKKDENNTARGLICKLKGYEENFLKEEEIKKDLKICLNCSKCKNNCPSKVNTTLIFSYKNANFYPSKFSQKLLLNIKLLPIKILYFLNFFRKKKYLIKKSNTAYFKGCIIKAQHKTTFLDNLFYNPDFSCCGLPYFTGGDIKNYDKAKSKNIKLIKEFKNIVFDCASCKSTIEEYLGLDEADKKKLVFFVDFFKDKKFVLKKNSKYKNKIIVFHKPCHMSEDDFLKTERLLNSIEGISYKRLEDYDTCCGFGGSYFIYHPIISTKIAYKKAKTIKLSNANLILTSCPSCTMGLRYNQLISLNFKKTLELRDFIENEVDIL